jgi:hypothetical protein
MFKNLKSLLKKSTSSIGTGGNNNNNNNNSSNLTSNNHNNNNGNSNELETVDSPFQIIENDKIVYCTLGFQGHRPSMEDAASISLNPYSTLLYTNETMNKKKQQKEKKEEEEEKINNHSYEKLLFNQSHPSHIYKSKDKTIRIKSQSIYFKKNNTNTINTTDNENGSSNENDNNENKIKYKIDAFAIYDGHGGKECSLFLAKHLFNNVFSELKLRIKKLKFGCFNDWEHFEIEFRKTTEFCFKQTDLQFRDYMFMKNQSEQLKNSSDVSFFFLSFLIIFYLCLNLLS